MPDSSTNPHTISAPGPSLVRLASALCILGTAASVALLAVALYRFRFGLSSSAMAWYAIAIGGIVITLLLLRSSPTARVTASLSGVIMLVALAGTELVLEGVERSRFVRIQRAVERRTGIPFDRRSVREVVSDLRSGGTPAMASVVPKVVLPYTLGETSPESEFRADFFPLAGVARRRTVHLCVEGGRYPIYESDEHGFLNPPGSWIAGWGVVALIGDSFVHGYCVPPDSNVAAHLRESWPRVLNLGTGGSGPLAELATLTEYASPMAPGLVLWMYSENDLADLVIERKNATLPRYLEKGFCQGLRRRQTDIDSVLAQWVDRLYAASAEPQSWGTYGWRQTLGLSAIRQRLFASRQRVPDPLQQLPLFERILEEAGGRVAAWGGKMVFVFLPAWERFFTPTIARRDSTRQAVLDVARRLQLPIVDLTPVFSSHPDHAELYSRGAIASGHYSALGYSLVARTIVGAVSPPANSVERRAARTRIRSTDANQQTANACEPPTSD